MMKNIRFYTIAVCGKLSTPKVNRCLHMDIRYSTFDIGSHVISCLRELVHVAYLRYEIRTFDIGSHVILSSRIARSMYILRYKIRKSGVTI